MALTIDPASSRPLRARARPARPAGQGLHIQAVGRGTAARAELEQYVRDAFASKHGATVRNFMPTLLAFRDRHDALRGVVGLRGAHEEALYLEQYLGQPVERAIEQQLLLRDGAHAGDAVVRREQVVEVGNLAGANCRAAIRMVAQLPACLVAQRYAWIVFTATSTLQHILAGFGAPLIELARAEAASVAGAADDWGRYYQTCPRVYAGRLSDAAAIVGFAPLPTGR
jgi:hypothetical protein